MWESDEMSEMKVPGPDHPIRLRAAPSRLQASYMGHVIADSENVILLTEADYPEVAYFPRADVEMAYMSRTEKRTHCPYKGEASYFTLTMDGKLTENAVWSYERPYDAMAAIAGRLAFYPVVEVRPVETSTFRGASEVDEIVRHTDAGDGTSQAEHWAPTARDPS